MAGSVNKVISMYLDDMMSIPMISAALSVPKSRVRKILIDADVEMRTRADGVRLRKDVLGKHLIGRRREFTPEWKENIRLSALKRGEETAAGISQKASGYIQITRGEHKHRSQHVVIMEQRLGRHLLPDECVHHIDGNKSNNNISNLALLTVSGHTRLHRREQRIAKGGRA